MFTSSQKEISGIFAQTKVSHVAIRVLVTWRGGEAGLIRHRNLRHFISLVCFAVQPALDMFTQAILRVLRLLLIFLINPWHVSFSRNNN